MSDTFTRIDAKLTAYLGPLTNNERGLLLHYALDKPYDVKRKTSIHEDLEWSYGGTRIPAAQVDRAFTALIDKGYATIQPKRGNHTITHRWARYESTIDGHGLRISVLAAPCHKLAAEKLAGLHSAVDWVEIADLIPTQPVAEWVAEWRRENETAGHKRALEKASAADEKTETLAEDLAEACRAYLAAHESGEVLTKSGGWWTVSGTVRELTWRADDLKKWASKRDEIDREARRASEALAGAS